MKYTFTKPESQLKYFRSRKELEDFVLNPEMCEEYIKTPNGTRAVDAFFANKTLRWFATNWSQCASYTEAKASILYEGVYPGNSPGTVEISTYTTEEGLINHLKKLGITDYVVRRIECWEVEE